MLKVDLNSFNLVVVGPKRAKSVGVSIKAFVVFSLVGFIMQYEIVR